MTPTLEDTTGIIFYFVFWSAIFWMIEFTFANVAHAVTFSWLVVYGCAALFAYGTVWLDKYES